MDSGEVRSSKVEESIVIMSLGKVYNLVYFTFYYLLITFILHYTETSQ